MKDQIRMCRSHDCKISGCLFPPRLRRDRADRLTMSQGQVAELFLPLDAHSVAELLHGPID